MSGQFEVTEDEGAVRRVRFLGLDDLATGWFVQRVANLVERFDPQNVSTHAVDILELHNVQKYLEHGLLPASYSEEQRAQATARIPQIRSAVARFFSDVDETNLAAVLRDIAEVGRDYHEDLLDLFGRNNVYERCSGPAVLSALSAAGVHLGEILRCKKLVRAYDADVRQELFASPRAAEYLVRKHLQGGIDGEIHIPQSFTSEDSRAVLEQYVGTESANPNYVGLIASARTVPGTGIDARLKLRAKRRLDELTSKFFENNDGIMTGVEVRIVDQVDPAAEELDESEGLVCRYTYSREWLEDTCDYPSILNNFIYLFNFVDDNGLLTLPSYPSHLGVFERVMGIAGRSEYKIGTAFTMMNESSLLQTNLYYYFLKAQGVDLEEVISWFFETYLRDEFRAENFSFAPSAAQSSFLQKVRHLFVEMESVASQFSLFVEEGELDRELLAMGSEQVRYKELPSLLGGKYLYATETEEIASVLHLLFSDQSHLAYISEDLHGDSGAMLLLRNEVAYDDFADHQRPAIDHLVDLGVVRKDGARVRLVDLEQFQILYALFHTQCASYFHLSDQGRAEADAMVDKGWVERRSSLLSAAEADYFNYFLNAVDFSNGPQLRNKYLHGSQANDAGEEAHARAFMIALRTTVALVIKINDEFCLAAEG